MKNKELKNPMLNELDDDALDHVSGGTEDDGRYWEFGSPPHYLNACPKCGGGVYSWPLPESMGGGIAFACGPCGWEGRSVSELAPGYIYNG